MGVGQLTVEEAKPPKTRRVPRTPDPPTNDKELKTHSPTLHPEATSSQLTSRSRQCQQEGKAHNTNGSSVPIPLNPHTSCTRTHKAKSTKPKPTKPKPSNQNPQSQNPQSQYPPSQNPESKTHKAKIHKAKPTKPKPTIHNPQTNTLKHRQTETHTRTSDTTRRPGQS
jgi:hypothetical protein